MPAAEVMGWRTFYELEPFGPWRDNFHAAMVAHIMANAHRGKNSRPLELADFFYSDPETRRNKNDAEVLGALEAMAK